MDSGNWLKLFVRKAWFYVKKLLNYPFVIKNKYGYYNAIISQIIKKTKNRGLINLRKRNVLFINLFIFMPLFLGGIFSAATVYSEKARYEAYAQRVVLPLKGETPVQKTFSFFKRGYYSVRYQPIKYSDLEMIIYGYFFAIVGAYVLSKHPAFKEQKRIEKDLIKFKKLDGENKPWKVVWTPEALFFESYGCDPYRFKREVPFWNTINFSPADPILVEGNKNVFIIPKKFELPARIIFKSSEV